MTERRVKRPRDQLPLAKLIGDIATGQVGDMVDDGKNPAAIAFALSGRLKGGKAWGSDVVAI